MVDISLITQYQQRAVQYMYGLPDEVLKGNVFAIVIFLILLYIAIYIIQKFTTLLLFVLKKVFLLIIVALAFYEFIRVFALKLASEGLTHDTLIFGIVGAVIGGLALYIALYVAFHSIKRLQKEPGTVQEAAERQALDQPADSEQTRSVAPGPAGQAPESQRPEPQPVQPINAGEPGPVPPSLTAEARETAAPGPEPEKEQAPAPSLSTTVKEELSLTNLKNDKRIGAVVAYIVIAEFGVFSSKTIAAPTVEAGLMFFVAFMLASILFIRLTYHDYWRGIRHLFAALIIGSVLSRPMPWLP
jgi:hypothetical protein